MLLEMRACRYAETSSVLCAQYQQKDWHQRLGSGGHADATMDRIIHSAGWVVRGNYNMREHGTGRRPTQNGERQRRYATTDGALAHARWCSKSQILTTPTPSA